MKKKKCRQATMINSISNSIVITGSIRKCWMNHNTLSHIWYQHALISSVENWFILLPINTTSVIWFLDYLIDLLWSLRRYSNVIIIKSRPAKRYNKIIVNDGLVLATPIFFVAFLSAFMNSIASIGEKVSESMKIDKSRKKIIRGLKRRIKDKHEIVDTESITICLCARWRWPNGKKSSM